MKKARYKFLIIIFICSNISICLQVAFWRPTTERNIVASLNCIMQTTQLRVMARSIRFDCLDRSRYKFGGYSYSALQITRIFKGNRKKFELSGVRSKQLETEGNGIGVECKYHAHFTSRAARYMLLQNFEKGIIKKIKLVQG